MRGSEFAKILPSDIDACDNTIIQAVRAGHALVTWYELALGDDATIEVTADVVRIGEPDDALRVTMSATGMQRLADVLGASLLTTKVADAIDVAARLHGVALEPAQQAWWRDGTMGTVGRMVEQSGIVDAQLRTARAQRIPLVPLVTGQTKDWVLSARLNAAAESVAANFGWHTSKGAGRSPAGRPVLQSVGLAHNRGHRDYSQGVRLMRKLRVDGVLRPIAEVLRDPTLHKLLSDEGPITRVAMGTAALGKAPPRPADALPPTLRKGSRGEHVKRWQRVLRVTDDGIFGGGTEAATKQWQAAHGLTADGVVGPKSWAAAANAMVIRSDLHPATDPAPQPTADPPFLKAKHFRAVPGGRQIDLVVLHTAEVPEHTTSAEAVARYFQNPIGPKGPVTASAHFCVDDSSVVQCVHEDDVAFAAPGANHNGLQIEMSGYAKQTAEDWADPYSKTMLRRTAQLTAKLCADYEIPVEFVDAAGLLRGQRGITTHNEVRKAFKKTSHTDPGPNFPMDEFLAAVSDF